MNYIIAVLDAVHKRERIYLEVSGNKYKILILDRYTHNEEYITFDNIDTAISAFNQLSEWIIKGKYSTEDKINKIRDLYE